MPDYVCQIRDLDPMNTGHPQERWEAQVVDAQGNVVEHCGAYENRETANRMAWDMRRALLADERGPGEWESF